MPQDPDASERRRELARVAADVVACRRCPRLRDYCERIAQEKRAAYRTDTYWGRPVPGFGDPDAAIVLVGLAPAAHGANRTGRMFTGDGAGGSGDFLMSALHAEGLASQDQSTSPDDGLRIQNVWVTAAARCAPPDNKPTPQEFAACREHLARELAALTRARVYVALGKSGFDACVRVLGAERPWGIRPVFGHGACAMSPSGITLLASYHPSRQNTHTGRLTPAMLRSVFRTARQVARDPALSR